MAITEEKLLASGFTSSDIKTLQKYLSEGSLSLDIVISDLSKRFKAALLLTSFLTAIYLIMLSTASKENIISMGIAMLIALLIIWLFQPPFLSYKAWKFKRNIY